MNSVNKLAYTRQLLDAIAFRIVCRAKAQNITLGKATLRTFKERVQAGLPMTEDLMTIDQMEQALGLISQY
ncbi:MAG TPA: hypothetical protein V6D27_01025 [Vampirovibrionales bacterium]